MNKQIEALKIEQEVPLTERLKKVPENSRLIVDSADGMSSSVHAVGYLCHKAAEALAEAEKREPVAEVIEDKLADWSKPHVAVKWNKVDFKIGTKFYTHPAPSWQSLSDDEIVKLSNTINWCSWSDYYNDDDLDLPYIEFGRAIEQALKEKNHG